MCMHLNHVISPGIPPENMTGNTTDATPKTDGSHPAERPHAPFSHG